MTPFVADPDLALYVGDVREVLPTLEAESVDCCVTSPPYWGLRDYGADGQLGLEATPGEYVAGMVAVFREVRRVLRPGGTVWLNLGDSYVSVGSGLQGANGEMASRTVAQVRDRKAVHGDVLRPPSVGVLPVKNLVGIPWRVASALQADGWYLRSDIVWSKPNPMPESVTDRPTKSHEYVFLLSKRPTYFFDQEAVREPANWERWGDQTVPKHGGTETGAGWIKSRPKSDLQRPQARRAMELFEQHGLTDDHRAAIRSVGITDTGKATVTQNGTGRNDPAVIALAQEAKAALGGYYREFLVPNGRNIRSVWDIATQPYSGANFATYPEELVRRCVLAGCPEGGVVLDPFGGSGTTGLVARRHGRRSILIELNETYARLAAERCQQLSLLAEVPA